MSDHILSAEGFKWFMTILTGGLAGSWAVYDGYSLLMSRRPDRKRDPSLHDKRFGYVVGLIIGAIGIWGCLRFHGVA